VPSTHIAFGLRWSSDVDLPDLPKVRNDAPPDVQLWVNTWPALNEGSDSVLWCQSPDRLDGSWLKVFLVSQGDLFLIRYSDGTDFLVHRSGSQVWCRWSPEFSFDYVATYLYGPIVGFLLRLRGTVCLHSSVAVVDGWAVGFAGSAGAGKSTFAATLAGEGFPVLSDDILALTQPDDAFRVVPTYPRLRLWPESVSALLGSPDALPRITEGWEKRHLALTAERYETKPLLLGAIYFLGERSDDYQGPRIEALQGAGALSSLIANTYAYKTFDREMRAYEFKLLSRLAEQVPLRSVTPFADISRIRQLSELVVEDFRSLRPSDSTTNTVTYLHV
jgi:hypothetical protein